MSTSSAQVAGKIGGLSELKARLLFVLGAFFVYMVVLRPGMGAVTPQLRWPCALARGVRAHSP